MDFQCGEIQFQFFSSPPPRVVADKLTFDRSTEQFWLGFHVLCVRDSLFHRKSNFRLSLEWKICWQLSIFHQMLIHFEQYLYTRVSTSQKTKTQGKLRKKNFQQNVKKSNNFMIFDTLVLLTFFLRVADESTPFNTQMMMEWVKRRGKV